MMTATEITWDVQYDAEYETWDVLRNGESIMSCDTKAEALADLATYRDDEIADELRNEICDLVTDLGSDDLAKLRKILADLKA